MTEPVVCIYCTASEADGDFNREHVIPEAFGRFRGALVLHSTVCKTCNDYFSRHLDLPLARDSQEGLERYQFGVTPVEKVTQFRYRSVTLRAAEAGDFSGAQLQLGPGDAARPFTARILPSGAMRAAESDAWVPLTASELLEGKWKDKKVDWRRGVRLFGDDESTEAFRAALLRDGVSFKEYKPLSFVEPEDGVMTLEHEITIDVVLRRAVSKIAFNYLAYVQGATFALAPAFDTIRRFIRYGEIPALQPVHTTDELPFRASLPNEARPVLHFLSLDSHAAHSNLLGVVSLFGGASHTVVLAENYPGPWFDLPVAHIYNVKQLDVAELIPTRPRWRP